MHFGFWWAAFLLPWTISLLWIVESMVTSLLSLNLRARSSLLLLTLTSPLLNFTCFTGFSKGSMRSTTTLSESDRAPWCCGAFSLPVWRHGKLWASWWGRTAYFFFGNGVFNFQKRTKRKRKQRTSMTGVIPFCNSEWVRVRKYLGRETLCKNQPNNKLVC